MKYLLRYFDYKNIVNIHPNNKLVKEGINEDLYGEFELKSINWNNLSNDELNLFIDFISKHFPSFIDDGDSYIKENYIYLPYYKDNKLVALCDFGLYEENNKVYMHINYISTDIKRGGIASTMVKYILKSYPDYPFRCYVRKTNIPSLNMFKSLGFEIVGEISGKDFNGEDSYILINKN